MYTLVYYNYIQKGGENVGDKATRVIKKIGKVIEALTDLTLKAGTLLAVAKMVYDSIHRH